MLDIIIFNHLQDVGGFCWGVGQCFGIFDVSRSGAEKIWVETLV